MMLKKSKYLNSRIQQILLGMLNAAYQSIVVGSNSEIKSTLKRLGNKQRANFENLNLTTLHPSDQCTIKTSCHYIRNNLSQHKS